MKNRINQLDEIRGLAALSVILSHILTITPFLFQSVLQFTPLRIFWAGHEAVIVFFLLSGFVLSLPFYKKKPFSYRQFLIKRVFRIYLPYVVALGFVLLMKKAFYSGGVEGFEAINRLWAIKLDKELIINHFLLITNFNTDALNPVFWSLVHEMRISLIFPILMVFILRFNWKTNIFIALALSLVSGTSLVDRFDISEGFFTSYIDSLHYVSIFMVGALLAKNRQILINYFKQLNRLLKYTILLIALCFYTLSYGIQHFISGDFQYIVSDWLILIAGVIFIILSLSSSKVSFFLSLKPIAYSGKISYSLYLYHLPILMATLYLFIGTLPIWGIYCISLLSIFVVSTASWYLVENTSIAIGQSLSLRYSKKSNTSSKEIYPTNNL
ncbi:hypothetical protein A3844_01625 [Paenibacillus helianthi]|uniref:Acyltransferase 3 domain-containing protein n=1 Tax=Paenibacillus helianthi TaxID=1349432 RepID=A0ABX3EUL1_9BACL|nr:acyltransferase [Paenibacillus helianthi]OKP91839.1 hypothetical protein A3844_01625 [Paenibacillus helianthi]